MVIEQGEQPIIFLDMDGVLADFVQAALRVHFGTGWFAVFRAWPKGVYETYDHMGITVDQFWAKINLCGADFWADLPIFQWTDWLIKACQALGTVCVLSSPSRHPDCVQGKLRWIKRVFGEKFRNYIFAPKQHKYLLAAPGRYLVEDSEQNAAEFVAARGSGAVIIPQPWNTRPPIKGLEVVTHVHNELRSLLCKVR